jgi:hypothetical protein
MQGTWGRLSALAKAQAHPCQIWHVTEIFSKLSISMLGDLHHHHNFKHGIPKETKSAKRPDSSR